MEHYGALMAEVPDPNDPSTQLSGQFLSVLQDADLVLLTADPLADIHNIRKQAMVMKEGSVIDVRRLPLKPIFYRPVPKPPT